jgi:protein-disulfide isomerase
MRSAAPAMEHVVEGNVRSAVRVIAYEDLQCGDCAAYRNMLEEKLLPKYGGSVAFEHRDFPLPKHPLAHAAAVAARYFETVNAETGIAFRRYCFNKLASITPLAFKVKLGEFAFDHRIDPASAVAALNDPKLAAAVDEDHREGVALGVTRTPTVFVNGDAYVETFSLRDISNAIDAALSATEKSK